MNARNTISASLLALAFLAVPAGAANDTNDGSIDRTRPTSFPQEPAAQAVAPDHQFPVSSSLNQLAQARQAPPDNSVGDGRTSFIIRRLLHWVAASLG